MKTRFLLPLTFMVLAAPAVIRGQGPLDNQIRNMKRIPQAPTTASTPTARAPAPRARASASPAPQARASVSLRAMPKPAAAYLYDLKRTTIGPPTERIALLRERAANELSQLRIRHFQLMLEATGTLLSYVGDPSDLSSNAEDLWAEAREHARRYLEILEDIEFYTGDRAEAQSRLQERLDNMRTEVKNYSVYTSDATDHVPVYQSPQSSTNDDAPPAQKPCHEEYYYPIEKVLKDVGFDEQGNPRREWHYDVVRRTRTVCDN